MELEPDEEIVNVNESTVYRWVSRAGENIHAETGDEGWLELGPHDLRRSWGIQLLEQGVLPSVVMEWGGWEDWGTFREHYLTEFSPEALRRECQKVDYLADASRDNEEVDAYSVVETQYP
jgi:integrase